MKSETSENADGEASKNSPWAYVYKFPNPLLRVSEAICVLHFWLKFWIFCIIICIMCNLILKLLEVMLPCHV